MLLFIEDHCPECKKKIYLGFKLGDNIILGTTISKKQYKRMIRLEDDIALLDFKKAIKTKLYGKEVMKAIEKKV